MKIPSLKHIRGNSFKRAVARLAGLPPSFTRFRMRALPSVRKVRHFADRSSLHTESAEAQMISQRGLILATTNSIPWALFPFSLKKRGPAMKVDLRIYASINRFRSMFSFHGARERATSPRSGCTKAICILLSLLPLLFCGRWSVAQGGSQKGLPVIFVHGIWSMSRA